MLLIALSWTLGMSASPGLARAQPAQDTYELRYDPIVDIPITAALSAYAVAAELAKPALVPDQCRWCDEGRSGQDRLNILDRSARTTLRWNDTAAAGGLSDVTGFLALPVLMTGGAATLAILNGRADAISTDLGIMLEALSASAALVETVKLASARERPYEHYRTGPPGTEADSRLSFHSGHTSLAFTLAVASGTVAELRGYRRAYLLWATGLPLAAATGYLRIAADKHYATDVIVGALAGSALGAVVPLTFHGRTRRFRVLPTSGAGTAGISVSGAF